MSDRNVENRKLAEWLEPTRNLDGFCICSASGQRLRDRDFDTREEAQRYIDGEDERLTEAHQSSAHGVNIQPCVKVHPDFFTSEDACAMLLEKMHLPELDRRSKGWYCRAYGISPNIESYDADRKTCICLAALALIDAEAKRER